MLSKTLTQAQQKSAWARLLYLIWTWFSSKDLAIKTWCGKRKKKCQISAQMSGINYPQLSGCCILSFLLFMGIIKNILLVRLPHKDYIPICFFYSHALWPVVDQIHQCQPLLIKHGWKIPQLRGMKKVAFVDKNWVMCVYIHNVCDVCMYIYIFDVCKT